MCDHVRTDAFLKEEKGVIYDIGLLPPCVAPLSSDRKKNMQKLSKAQLC